MNNDRMNKISDSLKILDEVFNKNKINYRIIGSVLIAALNSKPHRTIEDIDIITDKFGSEKAIEILKKYGYKVNKRKKLGLAWIELIHPKLLGYTFLMVGKFDKDYFSLKLFLFLELRILKDYIRPTKYSLFDTNFTGIPLRSIYEGLKISNLNPKRMLDKKILLSFTKNVMPEGMTLNKAFEILFFGIKIPYLYSIFSYIYNFYGAIRVALGKKYEIW